jgi:ribosomal protein S18 acetylase RimI-like enzyme
MGELRLLFEPFGSQHLEIRADFDCGVEALNSYLAERARKENAQGLARVHVLYDPTVNRIAGFYTLSSMSVKYSDVPTALTKRLARYPELPATLIGRLATDSRYRGRGLGKLLLVDALARIQHRGREIASLLVIVDAKNDGAVEFYKKFGFQELLDHPRRLFLPTTAIPPLLPEE